MLLDRIGARELTADDCYGLYFLVRSGSLVYIGKTVNHPKGRLDSHADRGLGFDCVRWLPVDPCTDLELIEGALIRALDPEYNGPSKGDRTRDREILDGLRLHDIEPSDRPRWHAECRARRRRGLHARSLRD